jgi:hypothetical protein
VRSIAIVVTTYAAGRCPSVPVVTTPYVVQTVKGTMYASPKNTSDGSPSTRLKCVSAWSGPAGAPAVRSLDKVIASSPRHL